MKVNEIFYSLQGEGRHSGTAAIFIRFYHCNLRCEFCDTDFSQGKEMVEQDILEEIKRVGGDCHFIVLTGGEPTIQVTEQLLDLLHQNGYYIAIETNGAYRNAQELSVDFITISPKDYYVKQAVIKTFKANEVKVVMDDKIPESYFSDITVKIKAEYYYIQPCDTGDYKRNKAVIERCIAYIKANPLWKLSLQTQKILSIR